MNIERKGSEVFNNSLSTDEASNCSRFMRSNRLLRSKSSSVRSESSSLSKFYVKNLYQNPGEKGQQTPERVSVIKRFRQKVEGGVQKEKLVISKRRRISREENLIENQPKVSVEQMIEEYNLLKSQLAHQMQIIRRQSVQIQEYKKQNQSLKVFLESISVQLDKMKGQNSQTGMQLPLTWTSNLRTNVIHSNKSTCASSLLFCFSQQNTLEDQIQKLQRENYDLNKIVSRLLEQITGPYMNKKNFDTIAVQTPQTLIRIQDRHSMDQCLANIRKELFEARQQVKRLCLQINSTKRKGHQSIEILLKSKDKEYITLKQKYQNLLDLHRETKKLYSDSLIKLRQQQQNQLKNWLDNSFILSDQSASLDLKSEIDLQNEILNGQI